MRKLVFTLAMSCWLISCSAQPAAPCPPISELKQGEAVLAAIGRGDVAKLASCGLKIDESVLIKGESMTPLAFAASLGKPEIVKQVLDAGADPNYGGEDNLLYPLEIALSSKKYAAARVLLERGAKADYALPNTGLTSLMAVVFDQSNSAEMREAVERLVNRGAVVNAKDKKGNSSLHWAARVGNAAYASQLVKLGGDRCAVNAKGQRPIDVANATLSAVFKAELGAQCPPLQLKPQ